MENVKLTKLASCAGCGAKVGAGMLSKLLGGIKTHKDERLIVGYDTSDDASVYVLSENEALVQTTDFFPPIVDDPYLFGAIAATNALSDVYAMGGEPKLALNIMCITETMDKETVQSILRGGYEKAYEAGAIITGGHTIQGPEPIYGLSVSGFVHPKKVLTNSNAKEGDVLILTKPLGVGIITTAAKADEDMVGKELMDKIYKDQRAAGAYQFKDYLKLNLAEKMKLLEMPNIKEKFQKIIAEVQKGQSSYEHIKKFMLLPEEFTIERGELTPTLKIKRKVVMDKLRHEIERIYKD